MIYTFRCFEDEGGCSHTFEVSMSVENYSSQQKCPACGLEGSVCRFYEADGFDAQVRLGDNEIKTLGHLAHRNTERMSEEEMARINFKNNKYKVSKEEEKELPSGMKRVSKKTFNEFLPVDRGDYSESQRLEKSKALKEKAREAAKGLRKQKEEMGSKPRKMNSVE